MMGNSNGVSSLFDELKLASDSAQMQKTVIGSDLSGAELQSEFDRLLADAETAGDEEQNSEAANGFRTCSVLAWALEDSRLMESLSTQALYYGTQVDLDTLLRNFAIAWAMLAHDLPKMKSGQRARLQDFARFHRSLELGLRARKSQDAQISATVSLLAPTFDQLGEVNTQAMKDRTLDVAAEVDPLWDEVGRLIGKIDSA
jgi:hypothetical protein